MGLINNTALVQGASGGIDFHLTKIFAGDRYNSALAAKAEDDLYHLPDKIPSEFENKLKVIPRKPVIDLV